MNKKYVVIAVAATIAIAMLASAQLNAMKNWTNDENNGNGFWRDRIMKKIQLRERNRERIMEQAQNYLNITREEGILEYIDGKYYIDSIEICFGDDFFLNTTSRSDYDMDGTYEKVIDEINGLIESNVVLNGVLVDEVLYVSHINGIWLHKPTPYSKFTELQGILEEINGSYYINDIQLIIKHGFSKSDIDRDGSLERMQDELYGLVGKEIKVDGMLKGSRIVVMHINGIWAR